MRFLTQICAFSIALMMLTSGAVAQDPDPFGTDFKGIDSDATGEWWKPRTVSRSPNTGQIRQPRLMVPRDQVLAFALYTHDHGVLKLTAQLYPLLPKEPQTVALEFLQNERWEQAAQTDVLYPGWSAHFRIEHWNSSKTVPYRVRLGKQSSFEGSIRCDPTDRNEIVVGVLSCNSSRTPGPRPRIIENLRIQDPDVLFFAGDQSYHHRQHTFGWLEWGLQFRDITRDRPVITIPDDHDVGQGNIWGESGRQAATPAGPDGGYFYSAAYVNMVQRCQTWHLPDAFDPTPVQRGISVYYTRVRVGGIDFAILEDRKFKSGPEGKIPQQGPRPDHINDPDYDRRSVDLEGLTLLGDRQLKFLEDWTEDWTGAEMKAVLSQTAFCGAVHLHGQPDSRLLADLDCNGWPQSGRNRALELIRRAWAPHLCGDQHLAVTVKHGIDRFRDGPFGFTTPAIVNTIYGRWWHPENEQPGPNAVPNSPLAWTGDYQDGLGNLITMLAYANPADRTDETKRGDGHGIVRFDKAKRTITFECWPRFASVKHGDTQYAGWPITVAMEDNDGRQSTGELPQIRVTDAESAVIQVMDEATGAILYTVRSPGDSFTPRVYTGGRFTVRVGVNRPDGIMLTGLKPVTTNRTVDVRLKQ